MTGFPFVADHPDVHLDEPLVCPVCANPLKLHVFSVDSGVVVDRCRDHGIWLDDGELTSLLDYLSRGDADVEAIAPPVLSPKSKSFVRKLRTWIGGE